MTIEEALQFLHSERVQEQIQGIRFLDCGSDIYIASDRFLCQVQRRYVYQLTGEDLVGNAEVYRLAFLRRETFRCLSIDPFLLQCKSCGECFEHCKEHEVPCRKLSGRE